MSEKSNIYLDVARTAMKRGYYDLSAEYYELYAKEKECENKQAFTLEDVNIAAQASRTHSYPKGKIPAIKELRARTNFGLEEAKELVEAVRGEYRGY